MKALVSLFTIIPVNVTGDDVDELSRRFWLTPLIGLLYGALAGGLFFLLIQAFDPLIGATVTLLAVHSLNRFLHFDGLIDLGDGLIATGPQEKKLGAMKDTRVGAGGVGFGILFSLLAVTALSSVTGTALEPMVFILPLAMEVLAKNALVTVAALGKPREGLGSPFVANTPKRHAIYSGMLSFAILVAALAVVHWPMRYVLCLAVLMVASSSLIGAAVSALGHRSFGCVNGDIMGATNELAKPLVLMAGMAGVVLLLSMPF